MVRKTYKKRSSLILVSPGLPQKCDETIFFWQQRNPNYFTTHSFPAAKCFESSFTVKLSAGMHASLAAEYHLSGIKMLIKFSPNGHFGAKNTRHNRMSFSIIAKKLDANNTSPRGVIETSFILFE